MCLQYRKRRNYHLIFFFFAVLQFNAIKHHVMLLPSLLCPLYVSYTSCWSSTEPPGCALWLPGCCWEHLPLHTVYRPPHPLSLWWLQFTSVWTFLHHYFNIKKKLRIPDLYHGWEYLATPHLYADSFTQQPQLSETNRKRKKKNIRAVKQMPQRPCAKFHDIALKKKPRPSKLKCLN